MKKIFILAILFISFVCVFVFRISIIERLAPLAAEKFGYQLEELLIEKIDLNQVLIGKLTFSRLNAQGTDNFLFENVKLVLEKSLDSGLVINDIHADKVRLSMHASSSNDTHVESSIKQYLQRLPLYPISINHLDISYLQENLTIASFNGAASYEQAMKLTGLLTYKQNSIEMNLDINDRDYNLTLADDDTQDILLDVSGEYSIDDDWLLLESGGVFSFNNQLSSLNEAFSDFVFNQMEGVFTSKLELDLLTTFEKSLEHSVMKIDVDTSIDVSSGKYKLERANLYLNTNCVLNALQIENCIFSQPQRARFRMTEAPEIIYDYLGRRFTHFEIDLNPSESLQLYYDYDTQRYSVNGGVNVVLKTESTDFKSELSLSEISGSWNTHEWSGSSEYIFVFDARSIKHQAEVQRALIKSQGKIVTNQDESQIQIGSNTSLTLFELNYDDLMIGQVQVSPMTEAIYHFNHKDKFSRLDTLKILLLPSTIKHHKNDMTVESVLLDIQKFNNYDNAINLKSHLSIEKITFKKPGFSIIGADIQADIVRQAQRINSQGTLLLGSKRAPLNFKITNDLILGEGTFTFSSEPIALSENEVIAQIIGVTGYPLQLNDGSFSLQGDMSWQEGYQVLETFVNLSALQVDGDYAQNPFENLNVDLQLTGANGWVLAEPANLTIETLNIGIPLENMQMQIESYEYGVQPQPAIKIVDFYAAALEGSVNASVVNLDLNRSINKFSLYLSSLSLEKLIELNQTQDLNVSGIISGELPMILNNGVLEIDSGWMEADEQGGFIKYSRTKDVLKGNKDLSMVAEVLEDFNYDEMSAVVNLSPDGVLHLETKLQGYSPDAQFNAPVHLNFNIELNLWKLLESARLLMRIGEDVTKKISLPKN